MLICNFHTVFGNFASVPPPVDPNWEMLCNTHQGLKRNTEHRLTADSKDHLGLIIPIDLL